MAPPPVDEGKPGRTCLNSACASSGSPKHLQSHPRWLARFPPTCAPYSYTGRRAVRNADMADLYRTYT